MKRVTLIFSFVLCVALAAMASKPRVGHIVYVGFDGWGSYSVAKAQMPTVKRLMSEGCYTLQKRAVLPSSSAVNWASMFMGAGPEVHGYTDWGSRVPEVKPRRLYKNNIFPTIFQILREQRPDAEIGVLYEWEGIKYLVDTLSTSYQAQARNFEKHPTELCEMSEAYIKEKKPQLVAICFDSPDHVGHVEGHDTPAYYEKLVELDSYLARIVKAVEDAGIIDDTVFIVTSDHGGINKGHGGKSLEEMETPLIVAGKGIRSGGVELTESIVQYDVAATMAYMLRLKQPQAWVGRPIMSLFK
ncbi:MAG: alkaline phosphatase [Muribaculaceae bacterium]